MVEVLPPLKHSDTKLFAPASVTWLMSFAPINVSVSRPIDLKSADCMLALALEPCVLVYVYV